MIATIISGTKHHKLNTQPAIPEVGQIKTHLCKTAYDTLNGVTSGSTVKPYFVDCNGQHDLWPAEFMDPVTKQTPAYPNWDKLLNGQAAWVTLVLTMKLGWKGQNKLEEQIDEKAGNHTEWWQEVPELEGEECDFLVHKAYQLAKASDPEDPNIFWKIVPEMWSSFVQIVPSDSIPELKCGNKILKIPYYAVGKLWHQKNKKLMTDFAHPIDFDRMTPPNISHFLEDNQKCKDLDKDNVTNKGPVLMPMGEYPWLDVVDCEEEGENGNKRGDEGDGHCIEGDE
ncbi:hypothetical protein FRC06_010285 [Ceratobasidium sp. 370]|nr:hypothetical protein FRC06_010285 [Ceratobasidium sp. 370]